MLSTMNRIATALMICLFAPPGQAQDLTTLPKPLVEKVEAAQKGCADFENGQFALEWGAVSRVDLDGDMRLDWVLNDYAFACSSAASLYCGTGGCESHFLVGDTVTSLLNQGWDVVTFGRKRVLLMDVHGSRCDGINPVPCVEALTWDSEAKSWRSVQPVPEQ
jgi:hypothetical protein